jgi:hypothetical protein
LGVAENIALGMVFLSSDDVGFMTGSGMGTRLPAPPYELNQRTAEPSSAHRFVRR